MAAAAEAVENEVVRADYPFWIENNQIYFDDMKLQLHVEQYFIDLDDSSVDGVDDVTSLDVVEYFKTLSSLNPIHARLENFWCHSTGMKWTGEANLHPEDLDIMLQGLEHDDLMHLLSYEDGLHQTALHWCAQNANPDITQVILDCVNEEELYSLLSIEEGRGATPLVMWGLNGDIESIKLIKDRLSQHMWTWWSLIEIKDSFGRGLLHYSASWGHTDIITMIHQSVTATQWKHLLLQRDYIQLNVLQFAAYANAKSSLEMIKGSVTIDEWLQLLLTPLPGNILPDQKEHYLQAVKLIEIHRVEAKIQKALLSNNVKDKEVQIHEIVETESLTVEQIQQLSPYSSQYIIPHKQKKSKRYGLILFSSGGRPRAAAEADDLERALKTTGCDVIKMEWSDAAELHNMIESHLTQIVGDCSLLIVCLMSHGSRGTLASNNGERIPVNDILHQLTINLAKHIPMVMLIQACQEANPALLVSEASTGDTVEADPAPTQLSDPHRDQHITLTRPHTVLLLATVRGGVAYRGVFTGAMADQFRSADGKKNINTMFTLAVSSTAHKLVERNVPEQTPKLESTMNKFLILPPVVTLAHSEKIQSDSSDTDSSDEDL